MKSLLFENFGDARIAWIRQYPRKVADIDKTIERYKWLKKEKYLDDDPVGKDISNWVNVDFETFKGYVIKMDRKVPRARFAKAEDYPTVFENDKCVVHKILSHEASCKLGSIDWCTTNNMDIYWKEHVVENKEQMYIFRSKTSSKSDQFYKIAILVKNSGEMEYRDAFNGVVENKYIEKILKREYGVPVNDRGIFRAAEVRLKESKDDGNYLPGLAPSEEIKRKKLEKLIYHMILEKGIKRWMFKDDAAWKKNAAIQAYLRSLVHMRDLKDLDKEIARIEKKLGRY